MVIGRMRPVRGGVDGLGMSEATVEVAEEDEGQYRDWDGLEAELQAIARSKAPASDETASRSGFWAKRRRKN
jgi:hypothetical protein